MARSQRVAPAPLFSELEENEKLLLSGPELLDGALLSVITAHKRLVALLASLPPGTARAVLLAQTQWSTEELVDQLSIARRAGISAANGNRELAQLQHSQVRK